MKILVSIPCYNCESQIKRVLEKLSSIRFPEGVDFLIVENHSKDQTLSTILDTLKQQTVSFRTKFKIIAHSKNYGLGGSFKTIFRYALSENYDHIILFHGDDQASGTDLLKFITEIKKTNPDCLLGARFMKGSRRYNYSLVRDWGNRVINIIYSVFLGKRIYDIGSGLNSYKVKALPAEDIHHYPHHIAFDANLLFHFIRPEFETRFMPIEWHEYDQVSNANNIKVGIRVLTMLLKHKTGMKNHTIHHEQQVYEVYSV